MEENTPGFRLGSGLDSISVDVFPTNSRVVLQYIWAKSTEIEFARIVIARLQLLARRKTTYFKSYNQTKSCQTRVSRWYKTWCTVCIPRGFRAMESPRHVCPLSWDHGDTSRNPLQIKLSSFRRYTAESWNSDIWHRSGLWDAKKSKEDAERSREAR